MNNLPITLSLPEGFLDEEIRDGYTITRKQKKIWAVELDLLNKLLEVCRAHSIKVMVFYGTLLGVIRHKGFIPWDDDIDVVLERKDYEKLISVAGESFKYPYFLQNDLSETRYFSHYSRLRNSETTAIIKNHGSIDYNNGIYIDVFVYDGAPKNALLFKMNYAVSAAIRKCMKLYHAKPNRDGLGIVSSILIPLIRLFPYTFWRKSYLGAISPYSKSKFVTSYAHTTWSNKTWDFFPESEISRTIDMPFEFISVPVPIGWECALKRRYGDYMKFPPLEERGAWHEGKIHFEPDIPYRKYISENPNTQE